jgi:hypothetical protein
MSLEATNITVDETWVENLIKKIQKYDMFKDQRQKIVECIRQAENDQKAVQKNLVTQNMVEEWCKDHKVKLVLAKDLFVELDENGSRNDGLSKCPCVWVKPFYQYSSEYELGDDEELPGVGSCTIHEQCTRCKECIDGSEGCWEGKNGKICTSCKTEHKLKVLPSGCSSIDICRPDLKVVKKVPKKAVAKKTQKKLVTPVVKKIVEKKLL